MDFAWWLVAFDAYAAIAACENVKQLRYDEAMRHRAVVVEVAALAHAEKRTPFLAVLYDELARHVQYCCVRVPHHCLSLLH